MARTRFLLITIAAVVGVSGLLGAASTYAQETPEATPMPTEAPQVDPKLVGDAAVLAGEENPDGTPVVDTQPPGDLTGIGYPVKTKPDGTTLDIIDNGNCVFLDGECIELPGKSEPATPETPGVTITDVEQYKPTHPGGFSEPEGWGLLNKPVNFVISAEPHVVAGNLLGRPADVRFTPIGFRIQSSDGAVIESPHPGATWQQLRQDEFTETPTSHVFTERGTFTLTPTVVYTAEYRFDGSGWIPVPGAVLTTGEPSDILIGEIETVLVPNPGER